MKRVMLLLVAAMFSTMIFAQEKKMTEIKTTQLPKDATTWITQNLAGGKIVRAGKIEENGVLTYVAAVEFRGQKHSYLFDKQGKFTGKGDNVLKGEAPAPKPPVKPKESTETKQMTKPATKTNTTGPSTIKK